MGKSFLLRDKGELQILRSICRLLPGRTDVAVGSGDDCAVVRPSRGGKYDWLLKSDPVIESVHFDCSAPLRSVGRKAIARCFSDIAAMGGEPVWALVNLAAPARAGASRVLEIMRGVSGMARKWGVAIVGGDLSAGGALEAHVFVVGRVPRGKAVLRSTARPGDAIFVTGALGGSRAIKHLVFVPRIDEGRWLGENGWASSMIDLSDGLSTDLRRVMTASRVGAKLFAGAIPLSSALAGSMPRSRALKHAFCDGEDYELLFTVSPEKARSLMRAWRKKWKTPCSQIGEITLRPGTIECWDDRGRRTFLKSAGYEHFR